MALQINVSTSQYLAGWVLGKVHFPEEMGNWSHILALFQFASVLL